MLKWLAVPVISLGLSLSSLCGFVAHAASMPEMDMERMSVAEKLNEPAPNCCLGQPAPVDHPDIALLPIVQTETTPAVTQFVYAIASRLPVRIPRRDRLLEDAFSIKFESRSLAKRE